LSDASRQRLIRAVRLLPGTVRVGRGILEEVDSLGETIEKSDPAETLSKGEESALAFADEQIRTLRSELRAREADLRETRSAELAVRAELDAAKDNLETEKALFYEQAEVEVQARKEEADKAGHAEGREKGYAEGLANSEANVRTEYEEKFSDALLMLSGIYDSLSASRADLALSHAPQLVRLWEMMLCRMLQSSVTLDTNAAKRLLEYILKRVSDREKIIVYLNPEDIAGVEASKENLMDSIRGVKFFDILSDDHVDKGSCLVETNLGIYDARWRTQLEQVSSEVESLVMECMLEDGGDSGGDGGD
jgi:flagellar assembly protein FliH